MDRNLDRQLGLTTELGNLTSADLKVLVRGETPEARAGAAQKLCKVMAKAILAPNERRQAQEILRIMVADASQLVRKALVTTLTSSPLVPRDVAMRLLQDVDEIALPILSCSPAFTDEDLVEVLQVAGAARQIAIALRPRLSERVTGVIADFGATEAVRTACRNDNAMFSERALNQVIRRFAGSKTIMATLAYRRTLPHSVLEKLVSLVSDQVRDHLVTHHDVAAATADVIAKGTMERIVVDLVDEIETTQDLAAFVQHLYEINRLSPSLLLRALANGMMAFFEYGLARLTGLPHARIWLMVHDSGSLGLRAVYERAGLPHRLFPAFQAAVDSFHQLSFDGRVNDRERFKERMLQRFLTQPHQVSREDLDYLLDRLDRLQSASRSKASTITKAAA